MLNSMFAIHIVVHGQAKHIHSCLESVVATTPDNVTIRIWDNASDSETLKVLEHWRTQHLRTIVYYSPCNHGFGSPHNSMILDADEDVICLLNSDVLVSGEWWQEALRIVAEPEVGIVGPICKYYHSTQYLEGCCLFMRRRVALAFGPFDTKSFRFAYCEDTDLSARAMSAGYKLSRIEIVGFHHQAGSSTSTFVEQNGLDITGMRVYNQQVFRHRWRRHPVRPRIVIRRQGAIGDVLCLLPAISAFAASNPNTRIEIETLVPAVFYLVPEVDDVRPPEAWSPDNYGPDYNLDELPELDNYHPVTEPRRHIVDLFAQALGVSDRLENRTPKITLHETERLWVQRRLPDKYIVFAVETGWSIKTWTQWVQLAEKLRDAMPNCWIVWLGGTPAIESASEPTLGVYDIDVRGVIDLRRCFAVIDGASLVIGADTGLLHVAAATDTPSLGLFGPVLSHLRKHKGQICIDTPVKCGGCYHRQAKGIPFNFHTCERQDWKTMITGVTQAPCMAAISPDIVFDHAIAILRG